MEVNNPRQCGCVTAEKSASRQARASCPGANRVINPVDMFILKKRTWGWGAAVIAGQTMEGSCGRSCGPSLLPAWSAGCTVLSLTQGFPAPQPGRGWGWGDDHTKACCVLVSDGQSQVPLGSCAKERRSRLPLPPWLQVAHRLCAEVLSGCSLGQDN